MPKIRLLAATWVSRYTSLAAPRVENETEPHCSETVVNIMLIGSRAQRRNRETFETSNIHVHYSMVFLSHKIVSVGLDLVLER